LLRFARAATLRLTQHVGLVPRVSLVVMIQLYCKHCDQSFPCPADTDAIVLLCPRCGRRMELREGTNAPRLAETELPLRSLQRSPSTPPFVQTIRPELRFPAEEHVVARVAEYRILPDKLVSRSFLGYFLLLLGGTLAAVALINVVGNPDPYRVFYALGAAGGILLATGAWCVSWARTNANLCVRVFPQGLERTWGRERVACRWEDIEAVWHRESRHFVSGEVVQATHYYRIRLGDGRELEFTDLLQNVGQLGDTILQQTCQRLLPLALQRFRAGHDVWFGDLSVSQRGLSRMSFEGQETLPWEEVDHIDINSVSGVININRKRGRSLTWWQGDSADMPNVLVFLAVVNGIVGVKQK
jgi:hypothetical protein